MSTNMVQESISLDELDLRIIHCLQVDPRAPWSLVGAVAGTDPTTALRRWTRMTDAGAAWITWYPPVDPIPAAALVEINCAHGQTSAVAAQLARDPHAMSVYIHAGGRDVLIELIAHDNRDLSRYVLERLALVDGIREVRTHVVTGGYRDASQWRLGELNSAEERRLVEASAQRERRYRTMRGDTKRRPLSGPLHDISHILSGDPRISYADLASAAGISPATARRRLNELLASQPVLRCDVARSLTLWPIHATFFLRCPADRIDATARVLGGMREARLLMTTTGPHNMFLGVWVRSVNDLQLLEAHIVTTLPHLEIVDRALVIRPVKMIGHLVDADGIRTGHVPIDFRRSPLDREGRAVSAVG